MVKISIKRELVIYSDIGLVGTLVRFVEKATEKNYVYLEYVPINSFPPKKVILEKAIHKDFIHVLHSSSGIKGVENRIVFIYTAEPGSLVGHIMKDESEKLIRELREKNRKLQMQVASSKQNEEDARSGVNKAIQSMKNVSKPSSAQTPGFENYGGGYPPPQQAPSRRDEYSFDDDW